MPDGKGAGRNHHHGRAPAVNSVRLGAEHLPDKASESANQVSALCIEHVTTVDMDDGQPLPPYIGDGVWHVVDRADGRTTWRRIFLQSSSVTPGAASPEDQSHAP